MRKLPSGHLPTLLRQGSVGFAPFAASFAAPGTTPATGALYFGVSRLSRLRECTLMRSLLVQPSRDTAYITCGATQGGQDGTRVGERTATRPTGVTVAKHALACERMRKHTVPR